MKRLGLAVVSVLLAFSTGLVFAQDSPTAGSSAPAASSAPAVPNKPGKVIEGRIKNQYKRIREGVKSKKLTKDEAKDLKAKVDAVKGQLKADWQQNKQNKVKMMTDDQYAQLKQMLDDNSKAIHDEKNDGDTDANAAPAAGSSSADSPAPASSAPSTDAPAVTPAN